jgi:DnaD/phage-associated family protein
MARRTTNTSELEFLQALLKKGFVNIPRLLFDYTADLGLDYRTIGKIFAVLACVGTPQDPPFGSYCLSRRQYPHDFDQLRSLIADLEVKEIVMREEEADQVTFSFNPLFYKLRAIWGQYKEQYEEETAQQGRTDPVLLIAQKLLGRPLSDREVTDIQDWVDSYGFAAEMVQAIIREGQSQGVTRMNYLNQIARQWHEEGLRTPADVEQYVQRHRKAAGKHKPIIQYLGLKRQLTGAEQSLLDKWSEEWGFSNEMIIRACAEAVGSQNPLQYVNRVLESWLNHGVKNLAEVEKLLTEHKRRSPAQPSGVERGRKSTGKSNVFLQREKKDEKSYDHIYKKFSE